MKIEIVDVVVENKGKYQMANVSYKTQEGKVEGKKIASFTFKEVFKTLSQAQTGDQFEIESQKNDKGYWDWTFAKAAGKNTSPSSTSYSPVVRKGGDWETAEERAKKQVYIVRQSSISAAIALLDRNGVEAPMTEEDVIESAKKFEAYVFDLPNVGVVVE